MKEDRLYLIHISECIGRIEQYLPDRSKKTFLSSSLLQDAILRNLQTMAESTQHLSDSLKAKHPEINWRKITGFRNLLVHDYLGVDAERVWKIIEIELPTLKQTITTMLRDYAK
jgi:uncharacterized protein with HEPN domain